MNKTLILGVLIGVFSIAAICLGVLVVLTPDPVPEPIFEEPHPANKLPELLEIEKDITKKQEELMIVKTYPKGAEYYIRTNNQDINTTLENFDKNEVDLKYRILDDKAEGHILVVPFESNTQLEVYTVFFDENDTYEYLTDELIYSAKVTENYGLLLKCDRTENPAYEIRLIKNKDTEDEKIATHRVTITNPMTGKDYSEIEKIREDKKEQ